MSRCPNCGADALHPENGCVLSTLIGVVRDRGNKTEDELRKLAESCDVSCLWDDLGQLVDDLESGRYAIES